MTDLYLAYIQQSASRDMAYSILALFGVGLVLVGFSLEYIMALVFDRATIARFLQLYTGGILVLQLAGLVILPLLNLD